MLRPMLIILSLFVTVGTAYATPADIVVVLIDDMGASVVGPERRTASVATPNIDALAANGTTYTQAYSAPVCVPSRAMLLGGRWPYRNSMGAIWNNGPNPPGSVVMISERLRARGYATQLVGKWGLGVNPGRHPLDQGFDHFYGFENLTPDYYGADPDTPLWRDRTQIRNTGYVTDTLATEAVRILKAQRSKPLFLYVALTAIHDPLQTTMSFAVQRVDAALGRIVAAAKPDTIFVFAGDNGRKTNPPLRSGKYAIWEGGVRVPFIVRWTGHVSAGLLNGTPVSLLDVAPTLLAAAGAPAASNLDGLNLLAPVPAGRQVFFGAYEHAGYAVRTGKWKLYKDYEGVPVQLYDVLGDKGETKNVAAGNAAVVKSLMASLNRWIVTIND